MKRFKASVMGGSGYGGAEIIRRLLLHPEVELVRVASVDLVGKPLAAAHLSLTGRTALKFEDLSPEATAEGCDVVFLGLPSAVSAEVAPRILAKGVRVIDMSGAYRLPDAALYQRWYGGKHPHPEHFGAFVYGLPELNRRRIVQSRAVASPGCFATTVELALLPLARAGLLTGPIHTVGITGSSGSGVAPSAGTHHPLRAVNLKSYKALVHPHAPEIEHTLRVAGAAQPFQIQFVPVSAPLSRGILATAFAEVKLAPGDSPKATLDRILRLYDEAYAGEPFVRFVGDRLPEVAAVAGSNYAEVSIAAKDEAGPADEGTLTIVAQAALDNLIKGGAGQAVQNMNLMLGLPETTALEDPGPWP